MLVAYFQLLCRVMLCCPRALLPTDCFETTIQLAIHVLPLEQRDVQRHLLDYLSKVTEMTKPTTVHPDLTASVEAMLMYHMIVLQCGP